MTRKSPILIAMALLAGLMAARAHDETAPGAAEGVVAAEEGPAGWEGKANASLNIADGNEQTKSLTGKFEATREIDPDRIHVQADLYRSESFGVQTGKRQSGLLRFDHYVGERWFGNARFKAQYDRSKDLDLRTRFGGGLGYDLIAEVRNELKLEAGAELVRADFDVAGVDEDEDYVALVASLEWRLALTKTSDFDLGLEYVPNTEELNEFLFEAEVGLEVEVSKEWYVDLGVEFEHEFPAPRGRERNDTRYLMGLSYRF